MVPKKEVSINNYFALFFPTVKPTVIDVDIFVNSIGPVSSINMVSQSLVLCSSYFVYTLYRRSSASVQMQVIVVAQIVVLCHTGIFF